MASEKMTTVLKILDSENSLAQRADLKATWLFSTLGIFMAFFLGNLGKIPVNVFTGIIMALYFILAGLSIVSMIFTISPRIKRVESEPQDFPGEPSFFAGICRYPSLTAYRGAVQDMTKDESATLQVYTRQIYAMAKINQAKYLGVQRMTVLVALTLSAELVMIIYLFLSHYLSPA